MKKKTKYILVHSLFFVLVLAVWIMVKTACSGDWPQVQNGKVDLSGWDFDESGTVKLSGKWEFYWEELLKSEDFTREGRHIRAGYINVPSIWNGYESGERPIGGDGFATYRVLVKLPDNMECVYFKTYDMATSYRLYVDGRLVFQNGEVSQKSDEMLPQFRPGIAKCRVDGEWTEIIVQIANSSHAKGGFWEPLIIGSEQSIEKLSDRIMMYNFFIMGFIASMSVYHMIIASFIRKEKEFFFFSLFCILILARTLITGERYFVSMFGFADWELLQKMEYLSFFMIVPLFMKFIDTLFDGVIDRRVLIGSYMFSGAFSAAVVLFPAKIFTATSQAYQVFTVLCGGYIGVRLIKAVLEKTRGAHEVMIGFLGFFSLAVFEIVSERNSLGYHGVMFFGVIIFMFMLSFAISKQFSTTVIDMERLVVSNRDMMERIKLLNRKLKRRNRELSDKMTRDGLSGLYNHRYIHEKLDEKAKKAKLYKMDLSVGMFDIDKFKDVNDNYGHQFGDKVIMEVARILNEHTRDVDVTGRYGGEEFLVIFCDANARKGVEIAERLRVETERQIELELGVRVTISGGVTQVDYDENPSDDIGRADSLLYRAKQNGRNRIESDGKQ